MDEKITLPAAKLGASVGSAAIVKAEDMKTAAETALVAADFFTMSWSNVAAFLAAAYTLSMLIEFWWKKFWKPWAIRKGWIKPPQKFVLTEEEIADVERRRRIKELETQL